MSNLSTPEDLVVALPDPKMFSTAVFAKFIRENEWAERLPKLEAWCNMMKGQKPLLQELLEEEGSGQVKVFRENGQVVRITMN